MGDPAPADNVAPRPDRGTIAVRVHDLDKAFRLPHERLTTLRERVAHPLAQRTYETLHALQGVSFEVHRGEFVGVIGRNGSGKSTLLRCLSGIYRADGGEVEVNGRLAPFIELGTGFNPEMTARDNIVVNGVLLGLTPAEARRRRDEIVRFAELQPFVDQRLKNFSSGMSMRLAFAVTTQVDADVLLFDEVLAVGDAAFRRKCLDHLEGLARCRQDDRPRRARHGRHPAVL